MNVGGATAGGSSQGPLNYLQRSITQSKHLGHTGKRHVQLIIRKVKAEGPYTLETEVTRALWMRAYSELIRLQDKLSSLDVMDKAYKPTVWALCKLSEVIAKFKNTKPKPAPGKNGNHGGGASALWHGKAKNSVPPAGNGDAA